MYYLKTDITKPLQFLYSGIFTADSVWKHMERVIDSFEIIIGIRGNVYLQQDEDRFVLGEGDCLLLLPGHTHKGFAPSVKGTSFFWSHFYCNEDFTILSEKDANEELILANNNPYFTGFEDKIVIPAFFHPVNLERLSILFHQLLHVAESEYYTKQSMNYLLTSFAVELTEQTLSQTSGAKKHLVEKENLSRIIEWINAHYTSSISLKTVAYEFSYTKEYLARYFKKQMGMSMQQYINKIKISKARELLIQSDRNIKELSSELGFSDDKYFLRLFKQYEKITPREYRRAYHRFHMNNT
jgi:AraC-like DNA-binding protein